MPRPPGPDVDLGGGQPDGMDLVSLDAWMHRIEYLCQEHSRQQAATQKVVGDIRVNLYGGQGAFNPLTGASFHSVFKDDASGESTLKSIATSNPERSANCWQSGHPSLSEVKPTGRHEPVGSSMHSVAHSDTTASVARSSSLQLHKIPYNTDKSPDKRSSKNSEATEKGPKGSKRKSTERMQAVSKTLRSVMKPMRPSRHRPGQEEQDLPLLQSTVESRFWEIGSLLLVLANTVTMGWELQYEAIHHEPNTAAQWLEMLFAITFTFELGVRIAAYGRSSFNSGWIIFDFVVVGVMLVQMAIAQTSLRDTIVASLMANFASLRVMRIIRLVKVLRVIRVVKFFRELRLLVMSIMVCMKSLVWAGIVMLVVLYVFGISITQGVVDHCRDLAWCTDSPLLLKYFGRLDNTMLMLYEAMLGGISWGELVEVLMPLGPLYVVIFLFFITFAILAVLNVVTGMFVETAMQSAQNDSDAKIQEEMEAENELIKQIRLIFDQLDADGSGAINIDMFYQAMQDESLVALFHALKLNIHEVDTLFMLLDPNHSGSVDCNEFIEGFMALKGQAMSLDVHKVVAQCDMIVTMLERMDRELVDIEQIEHMEHFGAFEGMGQPSPELHHEPRVLVDLH